MRVLTMAAGRPRVGPAVTIRLPEDLLAMVDHFADLKKLNRAEAIRILLIRGLDY